MFVHILQLYSYYGPIQIHSLQIHFGVGWFVWFRTTAGSLGTLIAVLVLLFGIILFVVLAAAGFFLFFAFSPS